jgi:hypothetical protein
MKKLENILVFLAVFGIYLTAGLMLLTNAGYISQELSIRSGIAYDLLNGSERGREALICSVWWAPLPTLLQLIFGVFPALIESGIAGIILSAIGGALMLMFLFKSLIYFKLWRPAIYATILLVAFNPWMLFHSATGASGALMLGVLAGALWCLIMWYYNGKLSHLIGLSILSSLLPLIKHQAILLSIIVLVAAICTSMRGTKQKINRLEGTFFLSLSPTVYSVGLWFLFNWLVMGDFVYFLRGVYISPVSQEAAASSITSLYQNGSLGWASPFFIQFYIAPFLPAALVLLGFGLFRRREIMPLFLVIMLSVFPLYHIFMISRGQSFGISDDLIASLLIAVLCGAYFFKEMSRDNDRVRTPSILLAFLVLTGTIASYMFSSVGVSEMPLQASLRFPFVAINDPSKEESEIRQFILRKEDDSRIAMAGFCGYNFIRKSNGKEDEFIHMINLNLPLTLDRTNGKTLYFIVPKPAGAAAFDSINLNLPTLYYRGETTIGSSEVQAHFMLENKDFPNWRIFTIVRPQQNENIFGAPLSAKQGS